ncbi:uncharacterized protein LOC116301364 [Actinia tenebrosa]|uniref:Uncharacterized protein LOC116301364 n=1 Tax=Actinia tenebrosa TaxID=6105 RepID=A0A6P8IHJ6_ACTTE|nr:uncharacterized protein LOC116301364 [Actinia tenebrosa]
MQKELADLYNDIFEREDRLVELCLKIKKLQKRHKFVENKKAYCILEEQSKTDYETKLKKILELRKDLLLKVICSGIALQDRERELLAIEQKHAKLWSLTFDDDPEDKLEEWKRDLRKAHSQGDVNKIVPRNRYMSVFRANYSKGDREETANQMLLP